MPYDVLRDLAPVTLLAGTPFVLLASGAVSGGIAEVLAAARARPDAFSLAHGGNGTAMHLTAELLNLLAPARASSWCPAAGRARRRRATATGEVQPALVDLAPCPAADAGHGACGPRRHLARAGTLHARGAHLGRDRAGGGIARLVRADGPGAHPTEAIVARPNAALTRRRRCASPRWWSVWCAASARNPRPPRRQRPSPPSSARSWRNGPRWHASLAWRAEERLLSQAGERAGTLAFCAGFRRMLAPRPSGAARPRTGGDNEA